MNYRGLGSGQESGILFYVGADISSSSFKSDVRLHNVLRCILDSLEWRVLLLHYRIRVKQATRGALPFSINLSLPGFLRPVREMPLARIRQIRSSGVGINFL